MKDLKLGSSGMGSLAATRERMEGRVNDPNAARGDRAAKGYDEVKSYLSGLRQNVTVRVKHGSGTGELALGKQSGMARLFKGDRSDLTAATLAKAVTDRFGYVAGQKFLASLRNGEGRLDLHRDNVLAAFRGIETMMGVDKLTGALQKHDFGTLRGDDAIKAFERGYPNRSTGTEWDGMKLSSRFFGDIVNRGRVDYEGGVLRIRRDLEDYDPNINFMTLKRFFTEKLGIALEDKDRMQNAMNNVLCFFEQTSYTSPAEDAHLRLGLNPGFQDKDTNFEGTISFDGTDLVMKRDIRVDLTEVAFEGHKPVYRETGWRYQAEDRFRLPLQSACVPHSEFKLDALVDAYRVEYAERGQRTVAIDG
jgi:hypothetical protein